MPEALSFKVCENLKEKVLTSILTGAQTGL